MNWNEEPSSSHDCAQLQTQSDEALMALVQANRHDAMALLFARYRRLVQNVAWRILHDELEAEDLVQSVFLEIFQSVFRFDPAKGNAKAWILQYAYHRGFSRRLYLKRRGIYNRAPQLERKPVVPDPNSLLPLESAQFVREAFAYLSGPERKIIELAFYEGLTMREAAKKTGDSFDSVRHHFYRGIRKLRTIFAEEAEGAGRSFPPSASGCPTEEATTGLIRPLASERASYRGECPLPERGLKPATTSVPKRLTELVVAGFSPRLLGLREI